MPVATLTKVRQRTRTTITEIPEKMIWGLPPYLEVGPNPNIDSIITEDDTPVDNIYSAKQQRLLVEILYSSWAGPGQNRPFLADANVGLFYTPSQPPLVPDAFVSVDVQVAKEWWERRHRSYFFWEFGKPPEIVVEVVSNTKGGEDTTKLVQYAGMGISYYVIFDPLQQLDPAKCRIYRLTAQGYHRTKKDWFEPVGLGVRVWNGEYENMAMEWLRWYGPDGELIPTGAERATQAQRHAEQAQRHAEQVQRRAEQVQRHAEQVQRRAEQEHQRAERLAAKLRALGVEPEA
ncbi:MAG: Uma2 family endonuclease [Chloroflexota bacterium]|nr:Uma2 family endonuclease [Chloroflexota bacterium]